MDYKAIIYYIVTIMKTNRSTRHKDS